MALCLKASLEKSSGVRESAGLAGPPPWREHRRDRQAIGARPYTASPVLSKPSSSKRSGGFCESPPNNEYESCISRQLNVSSRPHHGRAMRIRKRDPEMIVVSRVARLLMQVVSVSGSRPGVHVALTGAPPSVSRPPHFCSHFLG